VCLIPVYLCFDKLARSEPDLGYAFEFAPVADAELPVQSTEDANATSGSDHLNTADLADDLKFHKESLSGVRRPTDLALSRASRDGMIGQVGRQ
jgi:hypothetical protein